GKFQRILMLIWEISVKAAVIGKVDFSRCNLAGSDLAGLIRPSAKTGKGSKTTKTKSDSGGRTATIKKRVRKKENR
ncbi:MAG: hypothetical protein ACE5GQ_08745, partial [Nitrospinales bacterium]